MFKSIGSLYFSVRLFRVYFCSFVEYIMLLQEETQFNVLCHNNMFLPNNFLEHKSQGLSCTQVRSQYVSLTYHVTLAPRHLIHFKRIH